MAQVIISEQLYDESFLLNHTVAPFLVREDTRRFLRLSDISGAQPEAKSADDYLVWDGCSDNPSASAKVVSEVETPALEGSFEVHGIKVTTAFSLLKQEMANYPPETAAQICDIKPE